MLVKLTKLILLSNSVEKNVELCKIWEAACCDSLEKLCADETYFPF